MLLQEQPWLTSPEARERGEKYEALAASRENLSDGVHEVPEMVFEVMIYQR